jgi:putative endonuclease
MIYREEYTSIKRELKKDSTQKYKVSTLVYFENFQNVNEAIDREKNLKKWKRDWKIKLIERDNKKWLDLAADWFEEILKD